MIFTWTPGYFGINLLVSVTGSNTTPPPPPTTGGTPSANRDGALLRLAA